MEQQIYHGEITPQKIANVLIARFNRGSYIAQQLGNGDQLVVQIASRLGPRSGGETALSVTLQKVEDGVAVQVGKQAWLGIAASLGHTALSTLRNPLSILGRLDDLAQDIESLQLSEKVWQVIARTAASAGASHQLTDRMSRLTCEYCGTANPLGEPACIACGAPLGEAHPTSCVQCGFVITKDDRVCPNCGRKQ